MEVYVNILAVCIPAGFSKGINTARRLADVNLYSSHSFSNYLIAYVGVDCLPCDAVNCDESNTVPSAELAFRNVLSRGSLLSSECIVVVRLVQLSALLAGLLRGAGFRNVM